MMRVKNVHAIKGIEELNMEKKRIRLHRHDNVEHEWKPFNAIKDRIVSKENLTTRIDRGEKVQLLEIAKLLGLAQENQEAVKECYKEYIGMVKVYYEEAQDSNAWKAVEKMGIVTKAVELLGKGNHRRLQG
ncbi:hypothetical protein Tco_0484014 [Tanacetum coccineum]